MHKPRSTIAAARACASPLAIAAAVAGWAGAATAQTNAAPDDAKQLEEVVITGSRVIRDGSQAPSPVTVVSAEQLRAASPGPIGEALNQLPVFRGSVRPTTGSVSSTGPNSGSFLNLRNLGVQRTLLLVDGRRATPSALLGATDTNLLPQELVSRVDVVTGGASAAYGSDAVSGVVNFVLDTRFKGFKAEAQGGVSNYGDNESVKLSAAGGVGFLGGRGHVVFSGSYFDSAGVGSLNDRPWGREGRGIIPDPARPGFLVITNNINSSVTSRGGLITASPATALAPANFLRGTQFLPGGATAPFDFGTLTGTLNQVGGDGARFATNLSAAVDTASLFTHATFQLTPQVEVFAEAAWAEAHNRYPQVQQFQIPGLSPVTVFSGNAFLPAALQATLTSRAIPSFTLGRVDFDFGGPATADALNDTISGVAGFKATLPAGWALDGYYQHGENRQRIRTERNVIHERFYAAADAVRAPDGSIVCRVAITNPGRYPGCTPINLFGEGSPSQAALDYVLGTAYYRTVLKQDVAAATVRGEPFATWAGPVGVNAGVEYRREASRQVSDPISQQFNLATGIRGFPLAFTAAPGGFSLTNAQPVSGHFTVREGFAEALVPLAKDLSWAKSLEANGAVRFTDYSTSGAVTTWKLGASYVPLTGLRLRATRSRDIRAPNVAELFAGSVQSQGTVLDPMRGNVPSATVVNAVGNPTLEPEKADTFTLGAVLAPSQVAGLVLSVDYYDIDLKGVISPISAQQTVDQCQAGSQLACANVTRNAAGIITRIVTPQLNLASRKVRGLDVEAGYRADLSQWGAGLDGELALRAVLSNLTKQVTVVPGGVPIDRAGDLGTSSNPHWTGVLNANYQRGGLRVFVQERFIGSGKYDVTRIDGVTINDNSVPAVFYTDATVSYRFERDGRRYEVSATVNNAFNKAPPNVPLGTLGAFVPTNLQLYDNLGRYFTGALRVAF